MIKNPYCIGTSTPSSRIHRVRGTRRNFLPPSKSSTSTGTSIFSFVVVKSFFQEDFSTLKDFSEKRRSTTSLIDKMHQSFSGHYYINRIWTFQELSHEQIQLMFTQPLLRTQLNIGKIRETTNGWVLLSLQTSLFQFFLLILRLKLPKNVCL